VRSHHWDSSKWASRFFWATIRIVQQLTTSQIVCRWWLLGGFWEPDSSLRNCNGLQFATGNTSPDRVDSFVRTKLAWTITDIGSFNRIKFALGHCRIWL